MLATTVPPCAQVDKLAFTGSTDVGRIVMREAAEVRLVHGCCLLLLLFAAAASPGSSYLSQAGRQATLQTLHPTQAASPKPYTLHPTHPMQRIVPVSLELGGKSPLIIWKDADVEAAAAAAEWSLFFNHGQCCAAGSRVYVHADIYDGEGSPKTWLGPRQQHPSWDQSAGSGSFECWPSLLALFQGSCLPTRPALLTCIPVLYVCVCSLLRRLCRARPQPQGRRPLRRGRGPGPPG